MEKIIQWISDEEVKLFSDAWTSDMLKDTLRYNYNYIYVAYEENSVCKCSSIGEYRFPVENLRGYMIVNSIAETSELLRIGVDTNYRKKGYATLMMNWYFEHISNTQYLLEVRESNVSARGLYEKFGYSIIGIRKNYYSHPTEDGVIYERK